MNFIAQMTVKELRLEPKERWIYRVSAIDEHPLQTFGVYYLEIEVRDQEGIPVTFTERMVAAIIAGYDVILGKPWLKQHNPIVDWEFDLWTYNFKERYARQLVQERAATGRREEQRCKAVLATIAVQLRRNRKHTMAERHRQ